jgi:hypothetical protein
MMVELGPRSIQDLVDGISRGAIGRVQAQADSLAQANKDLIVVELQKQHEQECEKAAIARSWGEDRPDPELPRILKDDGVPVAKKFFRRLAGLRNGDLRSAAD